MAEARPCLRNIWREDVQWVREGKTQLDTRLGSDNALEPWRIHDLRRTLATGLQRLGTRFEVVEAVLNHVSGSGSGVAGIYQRHDWAEKKRIALQAWAGHIEGLLNSSQSTNLVHLSSVKTR